MRDAVLEASFPFECSHCACCTQPPEIGSSPIPCSQTYAGPRAFSEPEGKAVADFIMKKFGHWDIFTTIHSYGHYLLTTWGYTKELPPNYADMVRLQSGFGIGRTRANGGGRRELAEVRIYRLRSTCVFDLMKRPFEDLFVSETIEI